MPASFLTRHRTICEVIDEIESYADPEDYYGSKIVELCKEAKTYAQSMSAKLVEYKEKSKGAT